MPVRIYDIAKQVGITSKEVLTKAKDLGITQARVASSSLDKITAEFLVAQLAPSKPEEATVEPVAPEPEKPIVIVSAPVEPEVPEPQPEDEAAPGETDEADETTAETESGPEAEADVETASTEPASEEEVATEDAQPEPVVTGPKLGEKIGFIQLPTRPSRPAKPAKPARQARTPAKPQKTVAPAAATTSKFTAPAGAEVITMKAPIVVRELAVKVKRKPFQLIADLMEIGVFANVNQAIDEPVAEQICAKHGFRFEVEKRKQGAGVVKPVKKKVVLDPDDNPKDMVERPPVVTIMGHVDHGKTTLLDTIRKSRVTAGEAGGITQHIGAYTVEVPDPEKPKTSTRRITFLDTPGHAAFSAMRARGADVTDIVILIVSADDGVKPQTIEALEHANAAGVPVLVAVNKCDHPNANPLQVRTQLQERGVTCEEWGGEVIFQDVSATTGDGIDKLLELILLQAEIMELKANPNRRANGNVIESSIDRAGPTATFLVRKGTLKVGDAVLCDQHWGKVKALVDATGTRVKTAGPSVAVKILGLNGVPGAGSEFVVVANEREARVLGEQRQDKIRTEGHEKRSKVTLENLFSTLAAESAKTLKVLIKADTQGSVEAIVDALNQIPSEKVNLEVIHRGVGGISESDILLATASEAAVIGFHSKPDKGATALARREDIEIKHYTIIYELIDDVHDAMAAMLDPEKKETTLGAADVKQVFKLSNGGAVAGCIVDNGRITKGPARVLRNRKVIFDGQTKSLRRFQDEVSEIRSGMECGILLASFEDFEVGDVIESYGIEEVAQKL
ncbi:MAG: translation initiation factor IF-2 [Candidatus Binatia bacterium]|jgi:translation initiation factor IF-2